MAQQDSASEFIASMLAEFNTKLRDLEEKNRLLKERILLIGKNLIDIKQSYETERIIFREKIEKLGQDIEKLKKTSLKISEELDNKARKSEIEILENQFKMLEPLKFLKPELKS